MTEEIETGASEDGTDARLTALLALVGAAAGLLLWAVNDGIVFLPDRVAFGMTMALIVAAPAFALLAGGSRAAIVAPALGAVVGILAWLGTRAGGDALRPDILAVASVFAGIALACVTVLLAGARQRGRLPGYPALFDGAVGLPLTLGLVFAFTGGAWLIAWLIAALFGAIGLDLLRDLLTKDWFALSFTGAAGLAAIGTVRNRHSVLLAVQSVLFALARLVAPIVAVSVAIFAVALLFQGFGTLWDGLSPVATITATAALAGLLVNACIGAAGRPGRVPHGSARLLCLVLPVLMGLAAYGIGVRIGEEGLTPDRLYAGVLVGIGLAMALAYGVSGVTGRWGAARAANIGLLIVGGLTAVLVQTPLFRPLGWSASDQADRVISGAVAPEDFDYAYLQFSLGDAGERALDRIAAQGGVMAERVALVRGAEDRWEAVEMQRAEQAIGDWLTIRPAGTPLPDDLRRELPYRGHRDDTPPPPVVLIFPEPGEAWMITTSQADNMAAPGWVTLRLFTRQGGRWRAVHHFETQADDPAALLAAAASEPYGRVPLTLSVPQVGGQVFAPFQGDGLEALTPKAAEEDR